MSWQTQYLDLQKSVLYHLLNYVVVRSTYMKQCVKYNLGTAIIIYAIAINRSCFLRKNIIG